MTHKELVARAKRWLLNTKKCRVVLTEMSVTHVCETPDVIGFGPGALSFLVECKSSLADFRADMNKPHRHEDACGGRGMGMRRFYLTPPGLLTTNMLPAGWGLIEAHEIQTRLIRDSDSFQANETSERYMLISALWRATEAVSLVKPISIRDGGKDEE